MIDDTTGTASAGDRIVPFRGGHNFRDIGGYATRDGRTTAWRRVYRSGTMAELSDEDHRLLETLGLRVVCDFRSTPERERRPSRFPVAAEFDIWTRDHVMSSADLVAAMRRPDASPASSRETMIALYRDLAYEQVPAYRELFRRLADGPLPLVFHCSAGKDRTGVAAALLLDLLGVPRDVVIEDYALTDQFFDRGCQLVSSDPLGDRLRDLDPAIWAPMMRADPAYLEAMFTTLDARHGGPGGFLRDEIGVDDAAADRIRERLLV